MSHVHFGPGLHGVVSPMIVLKDCGTRLMSMPACTASGLMTATSCWKAWMPAALGRGLTGHHAADLGPAMAGEQVLGGSEVERVWALTAIGVLHRWDPL